MSSRKRFIILCYLSTLGFGNIIFHWIQPLCDPGNLLWSACLSGQTCVANGTCLSSKEARIFLKRDYSIDGQCGPANGGLLCDPSSPNYEGVCCSQYGWCGNTDAYCGTGCVANCTTAVKTTTGFATTTLASSPITSDVTRVNSEPTLGSPTMTSVTSTATALVSTDGSCGSQNGNIICGDWPLGSCCSMYGWCGDTTAHCGSGCQSGPCANETSITAPGPSIAPMNSSPGSFEVIGQSGVPAMHAAVMENGLVIFLDKVENYTQLTLLDGYYAYSAEFNANTAQAVPLSYSTNAFCSGGIFLPDGRLIDVGGNAPLSSIDPTIGDGFTAIRYLQRSSTNASFDGQSWSEPGNKLDTARWYASAQILPDGTVFVASGSLNGLDPTVADNNNPTFEILSSEGITNGQSIDLDVLVKNQPYYMYPFIHLLRDGSLFVFVAKSSELFNVATQTTTRSYSDLPGEYRTYPNTGGSVLLALSSVTDWAPDIVICGGGAYQDITSPTDASCGRIQPLSENPEWEMDSMPEGRVMVEGTLLPDGTVIWLNGCNMGAQGFGLGADPTFEVLIYDPSQALGERFTVGASSTIPRLYHSVALLLLDGTVLVGGSNPVAQPVLTASTENPYITEFRVERYTPPYLSGDNANRRPTSITTSSSSLAANGNTFTVTFVAPNVKFTSASVVLYYGGFSTHSLHMGQRMLVLDISGWVLGQLQQTLQVQMPPNNNVAPPGPYMLFVLVDGVPGIGQFVSVA